MDRFVQRIPPRSVNGVPVQPRKAEPHAAKRLKTEHTPDSGDEYSSKRSDDDDRSRKSDEDISGPGLLAGEGSRPVEPDEAEERLSRPPRGTPLESSLPEVKSDPEAIEEYEAFRASRAEDADGPASRISTRKWVRGESSIYVDAFNLALETVLEDEANLFDEREKTVFSRWQELSYEAQYLYVRLFLRKTAAWHRVERLGYYNDISDVGLANASLLNEHELPQGLPDTVDLGDRQEWSLGSSFAFADSEERIEGVKEAASLLSLDELRALAKEAKTQGKNKGDLVQAICRTSAQQSSLLSLGLRRSSTNESASPRISPADAGDASAPNRGTHYLSKILLITGPLVRLSEPVFKLFERVHLVFYRSTEWTEKSLTTIILAKISRRNFPEYIVCRSTDIFNSRPALLEFEHSMRQEHEVDEILESGPVKEDGFQRVLDIFSAIASRWRELLREELQKEEELYEYGEGGYLRRFNAAHAYTRIAHKAAHVMGRLKQYGEEHALITELLGQCLFHPARRGVWYQRKALLEEHYMWEVDQNPASTDPELQKKHWRRVAATTCATALQDRDCHLIYHYDLQKRLVKLERRLRIPRRLQHDFDHVKLREPEEHTVYGVQLVHEETTREKAGRPGGPSTKTTWLDALGSSEEDAHVSVEEMCLSYYRSQGWKGYHAEGGIIRTLFAYLFFDILFLYIPNVFQTAYQTCPLDLHTDAFYRTRASEINHRLVEIANGEAMRILREVHERERERRTCVVGLNWDYDVEDLVELAGCFDGSGLAAICKVMAQEYGARGSGVPDLLLWRQKGDSSIQNEGSGGSSGKVKGEVLFAEVKSANDRLSDTQRLWIHVLTGAGIRVALCNAVAKEVREMN